MLNVGLRFIHSYRKTTLDQLVRLFFKRRIWMMRYSRHCLILWHHISLLCFLQVLSCEHRSICILVIRANHLHSKLFSDNRRTECEDTGSTIIPESCEDVHVGGGDIRRHVDSLSDRHAVSGVRSQQDRRTQFLRTVVCHGQCQFVCESDHLWFHVEADEEGFGTGTVVVVVVVV